MSSVDFFFFRHGQTDWNKEHKLQGHTDIPLNDLGRSQARSLQSELLGLGVQVILTSTLARARETAEIINQVLKVPIIEMKELIECGLGQAEGLKRHEVSSHFGEDIYRRWISRDRKDQDFGFPGGESKVDHRDRLVRGLEEFAKKNPNYTRIAVSTHGGCLRRLLHHCVNTPEEPASIPNCALFPMKVDLARGEWVYEDLRHK